MLTDTGLLIVKINNMLVRKETGDVYSFGEAIERMKAGFFVARKAWQDDTIWVRLGRYGDEDGFDNGELVFKLDSGSVWTPEAEDILAEDWVGVINVDAEEYYRKKEEQQQEREEKETINTKTIMGDFKYLRNRDNGTPAPLSAFEQAQLNNMSKNAFHLAIRSLISAGVLIAMLVYIIKIHNIVKARAEREQTYIEYVNTLKNK